MASQFAIQSPYVVASLPRPIDHKHGRYVVGDVHGGLSGSKKRKRAELAVGIDGEGVNLYDIASSRLITSYALPPQSAFTCPPTSTRAKISKSRTDRRTYTSTTGQQNQISLFFESSEATGTASTSTSISKTVDDPSSPIVFLGTVAAIRSINSSAFDADLLAVRENGSIHCLDGETLKDKWISPSAALLKDDLSGADSEFKVEHAHLTNAHAASQGILRSRKDALAVFPEEISENGFNPELLILITKSQTFNRIVHVVAMPRQSTAPLATFQRRVEHLLAIELPPAANSSAESTFSLQASSGLLQMLSDGVLRTFDLTGALSKVTTQLRSSGAHSFLRLSNTSVMVSNDSAVTVYNPRYQSILATVNLNETASLESLKRKRSQDVLSDEPCKFVAYFPKLAVAIATLANDLVAFQIEGQLDRLGRPRATGLLIDSLGRAATDRAGPSRAKRTKSVIDHDLKTLDLSHLKKDGNTEPAWNEQIADLDAAAAEGDTSKFDSLFLSKLGISWPAQQANGIANEALPDKDVFVKPNLSVLQIQHWVSYALGKIFTLEDQEDGHKLNVVLYPPNVFMWLLRNGSLNVTDIEKALRDQIGRPDLSVKSGDLVDVLVEIDPDMDLLLVLVSQNYLGAAELLHAIRRLMDSLGLFGESTHPQGLLTNGEEVSSGDAEEEVTRLEIEAENDIAMAEYQLGSGSGIRGEALSVALAKLYTCPRNAIVYAIQTSFSTAETVSLIYLLRFELARGAWTSRYLDSDEANIIDEDGEVPNHEIVLVTSLLNNCVDAIGAGGWLRGEAQTVDGDPFAAEELISSLKLEVGAALEGIQEAKYLGGLIAEMVRYGDQVERLQAHKVLEDEHDELVKDTVRSRPVFIPLSEQEKMLPLGLKADQLISTTRVAAGGEIQARTKRDIGHLKSQKVGKYTLERIII